MLAEHPPSADGPQPPQPPSRRSSRSSARNLPAYPPQPTDDQAPAQAPPGALPPTSPAYGSFGAAAGSEGGGGSGGGALVQPALMSSRRFSRAASSRGHGDQAGPGGSGGGVGSGGGGGLGGEPYVPGAPLHVPGPTSRRTSRTMSGGRGGGLLWGGHAYGSRRLGPVFLMRTCAA